MSYESDDNTEDSEVSTDCAEILVMAGDVSLVFTGRVFHLHGVQRRMISVDNMSKINLLRTKMADF